MERWEKLKLENEEYMNSKLKIVLKPLTKALIKEKPEKIYEFIINWTQSEMVIKIHILKMCMLFSI